MSDFNGIRTTHRRAVAVDLKVVPGARSNQIVGVLGDRIKVRISAPAEDGRANQAVLKLMAECLGHPLRQIELTAGHHAPEKTVLIHETEAQHVSERLLKKR